MLTRIRIIANKWYITVPLCIMTLLYTSCSKERQTTSVLKSKNFTSDELFRGLIFGEGKVAALIPEITVHASDVATDALEQKAISDLEDQIIATIKVNKPDFLTTFKSQIESGNRTLISQAFSNSHDVLIQALTSANIVPPALVSDSFLKGLRDQLPDKIDGKTIRSVIDSKRENFKTQILNALGNKAVNSVDKQVNAININLNWAYAGVAVVAFAVAVIVIVIAAPATEATTTSSDTLQKEEIVNSVANNLAA
ncbi:hypothetical protein [Mucilaginibacter jinjuensis]|uniref:SdpC family antimicrobial peptide n=1 Tax=Mucilaginibacter jinjuensis TaxID=1176721 RepID=A0ABY7TB10_9SPHI|nr:hypothetical protein [Mucilaginibacter jinjuensis]WCT13503.1 hypothetical protein PQO05_06085 [Mucilaginibacter jinjuensis]